jgi:hypothetical protein
MTFTKVILPVFLACSLAVAQDATSRAVPEHATPAQSNLSTPATPLKAVSKERAVEIATENMKDAKVVGSKLTERGGKSVWAVTLKSGKRDRTVLVDAVDGTIVKHDKTAMAAAGSKTKHTMHSRHKGASKSEPKSAPKH